MRKNFVLDTNVLLHDPRAIFHFEDNNVIIPIYVIEEIDHFKKELSERGRNAREVARCLDEFRNNGAAASPTACRWRTAAACTVALATRELPDALKPSQIPDNRILGVALEVRDRDPRIVRRSSSPRTSTCASAPTRSASRPRSTTPRRSTSKSSTRGNGEVEVTGAAVDEFYQRGALSIEPIGGANGFYANQYLLLRDRENPSHTALGRFDGANKKVAPVKKLREGVWGIRPRNKEQHYALDLLLNDDIKLVTLVGKAGTGKTLLAIAAGLQKCVEEGVYQKLLVSRPIFPLGKDIGFLPGDIEEKLNPWMQPIYDNIELLLGLSKAEQEGGPLAPGADRPRLHRDRAADLHPRPLHPEPVHDRRRGAEPHAARGEDDHHARRREHQDRPHRRPLPDRQSLRRRGEQRPDHRRRALQGRGHRRPRHPGQGRALAARRARRQHAVRLQPRPGRRARRRPGGWRRSRGGRARSPGAAASRVRRGRP